MSIAEDNDTAEKEMLCECVKQAANDWRLFGRRMAGLARSATGWMGAWREARAEGDVQRAQLAVDRVGIATRKARSLEKAHEEDTWFFSWRCPVWAYLDIAAGKIIDEMAAVEAARTGMVKAATVTLEKAREWYEERVGESWGAWLERQKAMAKARAKAGKDGME